MSFSGLGRVIAHGSKRVQVLLYCWLNFKLSFVLCVCSAKVLNFLKESPHSVFDRRLLWWHTTCLSGLADLFCGRMRACAHRFPMRTDSWWILGYCYVPEALVTRGNARMNYSLNWRAVPLSTSVRNCCWRIWLQYNTIISDPSEQMSCYASLKLVSVTLFPWTRLLLSHSRVGLGDKETSGCWLRSRCMVLDPFLQWAPLRGSHVWRESTVWSPENLCVSQPTCI